MKHAEITAHVVANSTTLATAEKEHNLSKVLEIAMPILRFLSTFILIPKKWRTVIAAIVATFEALQIDTE